MAPSRSRCGTARCGSGSLRSHGDVAAPAGPGSATAATRSASSATRESAACASLVSVRWRRSRPATKPFSPGSSAATASPSTGGRSQIDPRRRDANSDFNLPGRPGQSGRFFVIADGRDLRTTQPLGHGGGKLSQGSARLRRPARHRWPGQPGYVAVVVRGDATAMLPNERAHLSVMLIFVCSDGDRTTAN